jgi:hypothetical protein
MRRRSLLRALLATGGSSALAGCNGLFDPTSSRSSRSTPIPPSSRTPGDESGRAATSTPYRAPGASADAVLDRPRGVHLRNLTSTDRFLTVVVTDGDREVLVDSTTVPALDSVSFPGLVATATRYEVIVEVAGGDRRRYDWAVRADLDDLWVDLTPDVDFHRPLLCLGDCAFAAADDERTLAYDLPPNVGIGEALGSTPALALDNDTPERRRATLRVWTRGELRFASSYDLPPDVRILVPVLPASLRYDVLLRTDDGETTYDWQPSVRNTLYASLADGPAFRCGYAHHDLRVRNETDTASRIAVRAFTGEETLFERTFTLDANDVRTVPSAIDPAGPLRFEIETADGRSEEYNWLRCAPNGPITVAVSDSGVYVSVRPTRESV